LKTAMASAGYMGTSGWRYCCGGDLAPAASTTWRKPNELVQWTAGVGVLCGFVHCGWGPPQPRPGELQCKGPESSDSALQAAAVSPARLLAEVGIPQLQLEGQRARSTSVDAALLPAHWALVPHWRKGRIHCSSVPVGIVQPDSLRAALTPRESGRRIRITSDSNRYLHAAECTSMQHRWHSWLTRTRTSLRRGIPR
jgi:hypothetical protein